MRSIKKTMLGMVLTLGSLFLFAKRRKKQTGGELYRSDFGTSTQKMGVHFSEILRQKLRFQWLKLRQ